MLLDPMAMDPPDQQLMDERRTAPATDQRTELSRLLGKVSSDLFESGSSSNIFERPSSDLFESGSSANPLETVDEEEGVVGEKKQSKGPTLWRCC